MQIPEMPFVWRSEYIRVRRENAELRNALKNANVELLKSRQFVAGIKAGTIDIVGALDRVRRGSFS